MFSDCEARKAFGVMKDSGRWPKWRPDRASVEQSVARRAVNLVPAGRGGSNPSRRTTTTYDELLEKDKPHALSLIGWPGRRG